VSLLLLIDDEPVIRHAFRRAFHPPEYETLAAGTAADGLALLADRPPDAIILDVHLPDASGLQAFDRIKALDPRMPVILITGHGTTDLAIEAMKGGAFDYLLKPIRYDALHDVVARACASRRLMTTPAILTDEPSASPGADLLVGRCPAMQDVYKAIGRVAGTDATVLLLGETGTGKELVARAVYQHSDRVERPFLAINCAAIPDNLVESELFGHEKGAFTGADRKRIGKFEQCAGGTILLDEIGELKPAVQVKLLRVLQERTFERVGGSETVRADVRVIAATNSALERRVADGTFRPDLFYRLNVFAIRLPPLRERGDDLELLTDYYLQRFAREFHRPIPAVAPDCRAALRAYAWPGNVRELQSVLKQAMLQTQGAVLLPGCLVFPSHGGPPADSDPTRATLDWDAFVTERAEAGSREIYAECLTLMERQLLTRVLSRTGGNQLRAAELLGITRGTLRNKLRALGLAVDRAAVSHEPTVD
jgi:DNA-binding NtrC family response regulator